MEKNANFAHIFRKKNMRLQRHFIAYGRQLWVTSTIPLPYPYWGFHFYSPLSLRLLQLKNK